MTPKQIEILNLRIAEHAGYTGNMRPNYANSLDAIVPVVQRWCAFRPSVGFRVASKQTGCLALGYKTTFHGCIENLESNCWKTYKALNDNPALALCIAFAQAAGLKGWIEAAPAPHVWQVGQYALCPDGKVRRVIEINTRESIKMHDGQSYGIWEIAPVPEPEMPELRYWETGEFGTVRYQGKGIAFPLGIMITACQDYGKIHYEAMKELLALDEWCKLTGRMV